MHITIYCLGKVIKSKAPWYVKLSRLISNLLKYAFGRNSLSWVNLPNKNTISSDISYSLELSTTLSIICLTINIKLAPFLILSLSAIALPLIGTI